MILNICRICNSSKNSKFSIKEMMLGLREEFEYYLCNDCITLQIVKIPDNMGKYYGKGKKYYSHHDDKFRSKVLDNILTKPSFYKKGFFKILEYFFLLDRRIFSISRINPTKNLRILDVGSGTGYLLNNLKKLGFSNLFGIDPYIEKTIEEPIKIEKINIVQLEKDKVFDLIMFHHSLEHIIDPIETLLAAKSHLSENGTILIRIPIISHAFDKYGKNWFQIDAPRHFFLPSLKSMKIIFDKAGLKLDKYYCDSTESQFVWSERYKQGISQTDIKNKYLDIFVQKFFSYKVMRFRKMAKKLNFQERGDMFCFYVSKK